MSTEFKDGRTARKQDDALTSAADSTMKGDSLGSSNPPDSVELRCCVERVNADRSFTPVHLKYIEHDLKVSIPYETSFCNIVQTVLRHLGYSDVDSLKARGVIVLKNWKPLALDSITDNPWAKVGEVFGGLSTFVTLNIYLYNLSKFGKIEDVKEKLLCFLLKHSQDVLQATGCPIKQTTLEKVLCARSPFPEDLKHRFNDWYNGIMVENNSVPKNHDSDLRAVSDNEYDSRNTNGKFKISETVSTDYDEITPSGAMFMPRSRLWMDREAEQSEGKHRKKDNLSKMTARIDVQCTSEKLKARSHENSSPNSCLSSVSDNHTTQNRPRSFSPEKSQSAASEKDSSELKVNSDDDELVPELPNKNAVYVVPPLPMSDSSQEYLEVVLSSTEPELDNLSATCEPEDLSLCHSAAVRSNSKDQNHNRLEVKEDPSADPIRRKILDPIIRDSGSEKTLPEIGSVESVHAKRFSTAESPRKHKIMRYSDFSSACDQFDRLRAYDNESRSQSLATGAFGLIPHIQMLQQQHQSQHIQHSASHLLPVPFVHHLQSAPLQLHRPYQEYARSNTDAGGGSDSEHKKRSRVFIDPISETPKLENWYARDSHPSTTNIEEFTEELNRSAYRQRFPKLEPKNVQLWFKNHRAKIKRLRNGTADSV